MRGGPQRTRESERVREERAGLRERVVRFLHGCVLAAFLPLHSACCFARGAGGRGSGLGLLAWLVRGQRTRAARVALSLGGQLGCTRVRDLWSQASPELLQTSVKLGVGVQCSAS